jgi:nitrogen-specific signal transduction histidine kinase/CheY-like chemotaxis protein
MFEDNNDEGFCFVIDLSERKKLEQQFLRAQRMESIGTLAGGIAHDLNNILAPIMLSVPLLKSESDTPKRRAILEMVADSAQRGADIVGQVLSFARGLESRKTEVQLELLFKELENIIKDTFPRDIQLRFSIPHDIWTLFADPTQVHQILLNLSLNARDAMPDGGSLVIGAENHISNDAPVNSDGQAKAGRFVCITVTDSGSGISLEIIEKIFEPFFTTKDLHKGTGLGLSTVMAIVKGHDGVVNVYSEPGKGTSFKVYLPAMDPLSDPPTSQCKQTLIPRGNGETIMVVDDEISILAITGQTLEHFGYRVLTANDGAEAVAIYAEKRNEIAVVLTDMMMPIMGGTSLISVLLRINPAIKIVKSSGLSSYRGANASVDVGLGHFLTKPYTAEILLRTIRAILEEP